jgi:hypothetical protein
LADLYLGSACGGEIKIGSGAEADHSNALSGRDGIARLLPADDSSGDEAGNLSYEDGPAGCAKEPGLIFVTDIDF